MLTRCLSASGNRVYVSMLTCWPIEVFFLEIISKLPPDYDFICHATTGPTVTAPGRASCGVRYMGRPYDDWFASRIQISTTSTMNACEDELLERVYRYVTERKYPSGLSANDRRVVRKKASMFFAKAVNFILNIQEEARYAVKNVQSFVM